jgi:hypothetical protein
MTADTVATIIGTGLTVGGAVVVAGRWALGMAMRAEMQPLREAMLGLKQTAEVLANQIAEAKQAQREGSDELHEAVEAIRAVLNSHETRITVLERDNPPSPAMRVRRKAS